MQTHHTEISVLEPLYNQGWVHIEKCSPKDLDDILIRLGEVIFVTDVKVNPNGKGLVTSNKGLDLHTDHHKAKYILWHCIEQTSEGGESLLLDALAPYNSLPAEIQQQLFHVRLHEHKVFPDDEESYPLVEIDKQGKPAFYYSFWLVNKMDIENPALKAFQQALKESPAITLKLEPGDILAIDNRRILHGRSAITGSTNRLLKRYWIKTKQTQQL